MNRASLTIRNMTAAAAEMIQANEDRLNEHLGRISMADAATWDAVAMRYGRPCYTFVDAFRAACGHVATRRSWLTLDLAALRECVPGLELPGWVYEAMADATEAPEADWSDEAQRRWYEQGCVPLASVADVWDPLADVLVTEDMIESEATVMRWAA